VVAELRERPFQVLPLDRLRCTRRSVVRFTPNRNAEIARALLFYRTAVDERLGYCTVTVVEADLPPAVTVTVHVPCPYVCFGASPLTLLKSPVAPSP
jgi:hypothetical protein